VRGATGQLAAPEQPTPPGAPSDLAGGDEPRPGRRLIFFIVSISLIMTSVDATIVATALPSIQHELHTQLNWSSWTITVYALGQIIAMPVIGVISQQLGRKQVFLVCLTVFTVTSLLCGLSTNIYELIALRAVQALGGGGLMPTASGIVADQYGRSRDRALGLFSSIFPIGSAVGPILGGIFVTYWSWRGIFLVNVPIGLIVVLLTIKFVPSNATTERRSLDARGIAMFGGLILSAMFGVTSLGSGQTSVLDPEFIGFEGFAVILGVAFLRHIGRADHPFVRPRLLYGKGFAVINSINFLYGAGALGFGALVPVYAEDRYGIKSLSAGTLLTARAVAMMVFAALAVLMLRRIGYRLPMIAGFAIMAVGLVLIALHPAGLSPYGWLALGAGITGAGMGVAQPAANNAMMQLEPTEVAAVAGLRGMIRQSGSISAVAVTSAIATRSANPGMAMSHAFLVFAVLVAITIPMIWYVPEHRGNW
jgi:EmrB/QacA subfamily drug resistance transporter